MPDKETMSEDALEETIETVEEAPEPTTSGFTVRVNGEVIATGYATEADAQAFIDSHLNGEGEITS